MAQITINIPDQHIPLIRNALASWLDKPAQDVTVADVRRFMLNNLKDAVRAHEWKEASLSFQPTDIEN